MSQNLNKLILGTVQFGLDYGINNRIGKISKPDVFKILDYAKKNNIRYLDTAGAYGCSEEVIGEYQRTHGHQFKIISKMTSGIELNIMPTLDQTLKKLHLDHLYAYLVHDFDFFQKNPEVLVDFDKMTKKGAVEKVGFSLYNPKELDYLIDNKVPFSILQIPYNIFDRRFEPYFFILKKMGVEIHVRSVFLQGLVFMDLNMLPTYFERIKDKLILLHQTADLLHVSISTLCLQFVNKQSLVDKIIIGIDSLDNLKENIASLNCNTVLRTVDSMLEQLTILDEKIVVAKNWKL